MLSFRDLPIRNKLLLILSITSVMALSVAAFAVVLYESTTFRPRAVNSLSILMELYSLNMPAPLRFNDPDAAAENLATLKSRADIRHACVYRANGKVFATYTRMSRANCPPQMPRQRIRFSQDRLSLLQTITQANETIGYLYIEEDMPPLYARLPQYGIMVGVVMLSLFVVSILLSSSLERYITRPVVQLSTTVRQITWEKDYSVRSVVRQHDEVGALTDSFNQMLDAIEQVQKERLRLIEQLKEAVRARDEFISIASHELRTPLTPLKLQLQILLRLIESPEFADNPKTPFLRAVIAPADKQMERLAKLVDNLLDVSRITTGLLNLNLEKLDLHEFISDVVDQYRPEIAKAGCSLEFDLKTPIVGNWDRLRMEQVVINLLTNAMKYGVNNPIVISLTKVNDEARLSVRDFGIGIPEADRERIFERFERAASSRSYGGLGLGLYITRMIVLAHGGTIRVQSEPGKGSEFIVMLPIRND